MIAFPTDAERDAMMTECEAQNIAKHGVLTCERCGKTGDDVGADFEPYTLEINDALVPVVYCSKCFQDSADDI